MQEAPRIQFRDFLPDNPYRILQGGFRFKNKFKKNKENEPLVSIITIVLNGERYLKDTIESVLTQDYGNIEYIIIDGGSKDKSLEIVKEYQDRIDVWYSEPDKGIGDAFNKGISLCTGELIGIINSDDCYEKDAISTVVSNFKKENFDLFCAKMAWIKNEKIQYFAKSIPKDLPKYMPIIHPSTFVKTTLYNELGGFNPLFKIAMDYDFCVRVLINRKKIFSLDKHLVNVRAGGVSFENRSLGAKESLKIKNFYFNRKRINYLYYWKTLGIIKFVSFLRKMKMEGVFSFLRNIYFFLFKKNIT